MRVLSRLKVIGLHARFLNLIRHCCLMIDWRSKLSQSALENALGHVSHSFLNVGPREQPSRGPRGHASSWFFLDFNSLKFPFPGFWFIEGASNARKLEKENIFPHHFPDFNLESYIIFTNMFIIKNLIDFRKNGGNQCGSCLLKQLFT